MIAWPIVSTFLALALGLPLGAAAAQSPTAQYGNVDWVVSVILPEAKPVDPARLATAVRKRVAKKDRFRGVESVIPLPEAKPVDPAGLAAAMRKRLAGKERLTEVEDGKGIAVLGIAGGTAFVSLMEAPIPNGELQRTCRDAWHWREACDTIKDHRAHLVVILIGTGLSKAESALVQTKIVAAVVEETNAVAVYWGTSLNSREMFLEEVAKIAPGHMPTWLWVSYRVSRDKSGRFSISTDGLDGFDLMEIEAKNVAMPFDKLYGLVEGMATYLITKGPIIRDRDTIGHTAKQRIRVRHGQSFWRSGQRVYRLEFGG